MPQRLATTHLTFIWYAITVYQPSLPVRHAVVKKSFIIRSIRKVHPPLTMRRHVLPLPLIHHPQGVDSSSLWGKTTLINGNLWLVRFHAIDSCLHFLIKNRHIDYRKIMGNMHVAWIVFIEITLLLEHVGLVLNLDILCAACLAHLFGG